MSVIEVKPHRGGWQAFEDEGVKPFFVQGPDHGRAYAVDYAKQRLAAIGGEVRVLDAQGTLLEAINVAPASQRV